MNGIIISTFIVDVLLKEFFITLPYFNIDKLLYFHLRYIAYKAVWWIKDMRHNFFISTLLEKSIPYKLYNK